MKKKSSSKKWLRDHFSDPYVLKAQQEGYRARSVYKLLELQEKNHLLKPGMNVVDLGAAPGGWSQLAKKIVGEKGKVFAIDILAMEPIHGVDILQGDFNDEAIVEKLAEKISLCKIDWVICDMSPNISGIESVDQPRSIALAELAVEFAIKILQKNSGFLIKVFQGDGFDDLLKIIRTNFTKVAIKKPKASSDRSREMYILAYR